ncbi:protealysin inhibitor emfourin [Pedococcus sp. NPDC057267]|uniref:protealysin inhibitor emfourin n=1 Tax=Pedococcus sp. NPDC057267 TaxID=3346077 RepID=UPI0036365FA4
MATEELHITYRRSGGFAGIDLVAECLGADLPEDQAQVAAALLGGSGSGNAPAGPGAPTSTAGSVEGTAPPAPGPTGADQFTYTVHVVQGRRSRTVTWADTTVPDEARPLLATLGGLARPTRAR